MRSKRRLAIVGAAVIAISGVGIGAATSAGVVFAAPTPAVYTACVAHATGALYGVTTNGTPTCQAQDTTITWGEQGPAGPPGPAQLESWSSCTGTLCIDAPPEGPTGLDGSGGWGWDNVTNSPVSTLTVGTSASFVVTVLQPSTTPACGSSSGTITLSYSSQDFSLSSTDSRTSTSTTPFDRGGVRTRAGTVSPRGMTDSEQSSYFSTSSEKEAPSA